MAALTSRRRWLQAMLRRSSCTRVRLAHSQAQSPRRKRERLTYTRKAFSELLLLDEEHIESAQQKPHSGNPSQLRRGEGEQPVSSSRLTGLTGLRLRVQTAASTCRPSPAARPEAASPSSAPLTTQRPAEPPWPRVLRPRAIGVAHSIRTAFAVLTSSLLAISTGRDYVASDAGNSPSSPFVIHGREARSHRLRCRPVTTMH
jgi:hypothetical protein